MEHAATEQQQAPTSAKPMLPNLSRSASHPATQPGTVTACALLLLTRGASTPQSRSTFKERSRGAQPEAFKP